MLMRCDAPAQAVAEVDALRELASDHAEQQGAARLLRVTRRQSRCAVARQQRLHRGRGARLAKHGLRRAKSKWAQTRATSIQNKQAHTRAFAAASAVMAPVAAQRAAQVSAYSKLGKKATTP